MGIEPTHRSFADSSVPISPPDHYLVLGKGFEPLLTANLANRGYKSRRATVTLPKHWLRLTGCFLVRGVYIPVILTREHGSTEISLQANGGLTEN